jgi:hypothetical protein
MVGQLGYLFEERPELSGARSWSSSPTRCDRAMTMLDSVARPTA